MKNKVMGVKIRINTRNLKKVAKQFDIAHKRIESSVAQLLAKFPVGLRPQYIGFFGTREQIEASIERLQMSRPAGRRPIAGTSWGQSKDEGALP